MPSIQEQNAQIAAMYPNLHITPSAGYTGGAGYASPASEQYWNPTPAYTPPAPAAPAAPAAQAYTPPPTAAASTVSSGGYTQSPSNYYPSQAAPAQASPTPYPRGPQAIPLGTPGTYQSPGGRVIPQSYAPVAAAQTAYAHGAGNGQDMQGYMTSQGFGTDYFSGGTLGGVSSTGFNWNTMSSPAMDAAAGLKPGQSGLSALGYSG